MSDSHLARKAHNVISVDIYLFFSQHSHIITSDGRVQLSRSLITFIAGFTSFSLYVLVHEMLLSEQDSGF